jgi:hypothetical protein
MHPIRNMPNPPHLLLRRDAHGTADSDQALLVPVSPAADPLTGLTGLSGTLPSRDRQRQAENVPLWKARATWFILDFGSWDTWFGPTKT